MHPYEKKIYITLLAGIIVLLALLVFFVITILRYHRKMNNLRREKIGEEINSLDKEKERISFDLHDDLGASLAGIKLRLHTLSGLDKANFDKVVNIEHKLDEVMGRLKEVAVSLMPRMLQRKGLDKALRALLNDFSNTTGIGVGYSCTVTEFKAGTTLHIYRIAQEVLANISKHANASHVTFSICRSRHKIELKMTDNGIGFNVKAARRNNGGGLGLQNITARAELLQAEIYLTSVKNNGVTYQIEIPDR